MKSIVDISNTKGERRGQDTNPDRAVLPILPYTTKFRVCKRAVIDAAARPPTPAHPSRYILARTVPCLLHYQ
jgi:hypothetical protein